MSSPLRRLVRLSSLVVPLFVIASQSAASAGSVWYSDPGTLGEANGWASQLTFTDPAVIATVTTTNAAYYAGLGDGTCMTTDPCGWWGVDDADGNWSDTDGLSRSNSEAALTPSVVKDYEGVTWTWRSPLCGEDSYPTVDTPIRRCSNIATVTIDFDVPVTNAIVHINNLGGNGTNDGYDTTLFSQWTLTSGQNIFMLSGSSTTNITLSGRTIRNRFTPQGLGARVSTRESVFDDPDTFYDNGTGTGSFLIPGTYQQLTFDIDLTWALVNYISGDPAFSNIPEGVTLQLSFYEGPLPNLPSVDSDYLERRTEEVSDLPNTGGNTALFTWTALALFGSGATVLGLRRRGGRNIC